MVVTLRTNLAKSPLTAALKGGLIHSDLVQLQFCGPELAHDGFGPLVREQAFDAGELALSTFLQGREFGREWILIPAVLSGGYQHGCIGFNADFGDRTLRNIEGTTIAARSYTQTTAMWVRGILQHEYGVSLNSLKWLCSDACHFEEHRDPVNATLMQTPQSIDELVLNGRIDAAVLGRAYMPKEARIRPVIPNPWEEARLWSERHDAIPINHVFMVTSEAVRGRPEIVAELYRMLCVSKEKAPVDEGLDMRPFGFEKNRNSLEIGIQFALEQGIISKVVSVDELYADAQRAFSMHGLPNSKSVKAVRH